MTIMTDALPFPPETYRARCRALCDAMAEQGLDLLYVTSPVNLAYLTGYAANWYPPRLPVGLVVERASGRTMLVDWSRRAAYAAARAVSDGVHCIDYGSASQSIAALFAREGWGGARIGIDYASPTPVPQVLNALVAALQAGGAQIMSGDWIVDTVRLYKEAEELVRLRRAAGIADEAMRQIATELKPGLKPVEISVRMAELLVRGGSGHAALPPIVFAGGSAAFDLHAPASHLPVETGDIVGIDCCAVIDGYHASLARSFLMGGGPHIAGPWLKATAEAAGLLREEARPGEGTEIALRAAEAHIRGVVPADNIWWIGGYSFGLAVAPSWVGHAYLANDGPARCVWGEGFVANFETIFVDPVRGFAAEAIDTIVMAGSELTILSGLPRDLIPVRY